MSRKMTDGTTSGAVSPGGMMAWSNKRLLRVSDVRKGYITFFLK